MIRHKHMGEVRVCKILPLFCQQGMHFKAGSLFFKWRKKIIDTWVSRGTSPIWCAAKQLVDRSDWNHWSGTNTTNKEQPSSWISFWVELLVLGKQLCSARDGRNSWTPSLLGVSPELRQPGMSLQPPHCPLLHVTLLLADGTALTHKCPVSAHPG